MFGGSLNYDDLFEERLKPPALDPPPSRDRASKLGQRPAGFAQSGACCVYGCHPPSASNFILPNLCIKIGR